MITDANAIARTMTELIHGEGVTFTLPVTVELLDLNGECILVTRHEENGKRDQWRPNPEGVCTAATELRIYDNSGNSATFSLLDGCGLCEVQQ